jgi:hypothetical protein
MRRQPHVSGQGPILLSAIEACWTPLRESLVPYKGSRADTPDRCG